jgi:hypothetical protein
MKAHELAQVLLTGPNVEVVFSDSIGPIDIESCFESKITENDADNCGNCERRVGEAVIALSN